MKNNFYKKKIILMIALCVIVIVGGLISVFDFYYKIKRFPKPSLSTQQADWVLSSASRRKSLIPFWKRSKAAGYYTQNGIKFFFFFPAALISWGVAFGLSLMPRLTIGKVVVNKSLISLDKKKDAIKVNTADQQSLSAVLFVRCLVNQPKNLVGLL